MGESDIFVTMSRVFWMLIELYNVKAMHLWIHNLLFRRRDDTCSRAIVSVLFALKGGKLQVEIASRIDVLRVVQPQCPPSNVYYHAAP